MRKDIPLIVPDDECENVALSIAAIRKIGLLNSGRAFLVYWNLVAHRHPGERYVEISAAHIGRSIGYSERAVSESLRKLEEGGLVLVDRFEGKPNRYTFPLEDYYAMEEILCIA